MQALVLKLDNQPVITIAIAQVRILATLEGSPGNVIQAVLPGTHQNDRFLGITKRQMLRHGKAANFKAQTFKA